MMNARAKKEFPEALQKRGTSGNFYVMTNLVQELKAFTYLCSLATRYFTHE